VEVADSKIKVLVVEDSSVVQAQLVHILNSDPQVTVSGTARNGIEALEQLNRHSPDVVLMDIEMPEMDGFEATRRIMETRPVPIVICCGSTNPRETITTFRVMEAGAVACIEKPVGSGSDRFAAMAAELLQTVKLMAEVKVVRRWPRLRRDTAGSEPAPPIPPRQRLRRIEVIGIGASTGGPPVLQSIITGLPKDFAVPVLVVQHIAAGFLPALVEWLNQTTGFKVRVAEFGMEPLPGHVYFAPDDYHMSFAAGGHLRLTREPRENGLRPSVAHLFRSLAESCGAGAVGVLLTGMGKDGAEELKLMKDSGATTIVQDRETSVIHGMPGEAIALGAAMHVLPTERIAPMLVTLVNQANLPGGRTQ
jgi:two-component system chemotaxis response regulator CheB